MGVAVFPAPSAGGKILKKLTLTSGTSWTVPAGVTDINVLCVGGGGGNAGQSWGSAVTGIAQGGPGETIWSTLTVTPGASIAYSIGAGGNGSGVNDGAGNGGATSFTGATTAAGGNRGRYDQNGMTGSRSYANNAGLSPIAVGAVQSSGGGGHGWIEIEYWV